MSIASGTKLGSYEITGAIGAGGMGEVYQAHDTKLGRNVAIKVLPEAFAHDPERLSRFQREAKMLASLNHPNIATIHGLEHSNGTDYLVMELVPGETLRERIARDGPVPVEEALGICRQIAEALEAAHEKGIIHRDLKPANVKVTPEGKVKVLDFGLAKAFADDPTSSNLSESPTLSVAATMRGVILGTAAYMSPEQARGKAVDKRTDIWAFACVLYELLTGKQAFNGEDITDILAAVVRAEPDWQALPAATPIQVRDLLRRCLQKDKTLRLQAAGDARIEIQEALTAPATAEPVAAPRQRISERIVWSVAAIGVVAALVLAFLYFRRAPPEMQSVRFFVDSPEKTTFYSAPSLVSVSPDGTRLAFVALDSSGKQLLWVRALDSLTAQPLLGTDEASQPFWSPDSRFIAFSAENKLKKIAVTGGPPQTLAAAASLQVMGTWNREGVILFGTNGVPPINTIQRVSAAGGTPTPVTTLDASRQQDFHAWPCFLPDGKHFLYLAHSANPENSAIYVGSLDSKDTKLLLNANSFILYSPPGYLLFVREGTLVAQPFDASRLELTGDAFPVAEDVESNPVNGRAAFAVSESGVLAYRTGGTFGGQFAWTDLAGKEVTRFGDISTMAVNAHFSLSPDEKRLAIDLTTPQGRDVWLLDITRGTTSRFALGLLSAGLVWSPDSNWLTFAASRSGVTGLYRRLSNGAGQDELLLNAPAAQPTDWSQDGRFLMYQTIDPKTKWDLWVLPLSGDRKPKPFLQTEFDESQGQFSPDGRWVAYSSNESGRPEVYVQPFPGPGPKVQISTAGGVQPKWRRDGKELFYRIDVTSKLMAVEIKTDGQFQAGVPHPLPWEASITTHGMSAGDHYAVGADGKRLFSIKPKQESAASPVTVVLNWAAGLKK